jgi:TPR repeat protein
MNLSCSFFRLLLFLACSLPLAVPAQEWWGRSIHDAAWTNKPVAEIEAAARDGDALARYYFARHRFVNAARIEDWRESFQWVMRAAEAGLADAQFMAARFHMSGTATGENPDAGFNWAKQAAEQNHPDGIALLADAHASGTGTRRDAAKARELYGRAIDAGSILGLDWLGHFYLSGEGGTTTRTNRAAALRCFERAASNGMAHAASHVISMYRDGVGAPPDIERAVYWARHFADQLDPTSIEALVDFYVSGVAEPRGPQDSPTVWTRRMAESRARRTDADDGASAPEDSYFTLVKHCRNLAGRFRYGVGTSRDHVAAATWMLVAYRQDVARGRNKDIRQGQPLHPFEEAARSTDRQPGEEGLWQEALRRIHRALEKGDAAACRDIGLAYRDGSAFTPQDSIMACLWLARAKELGESQAAAELAALEQKLAPDDLAAVKKRFLPRSKR